MTARGLELGIGVGWREEIAGFIAGLQDLRFVEVVAETMPSDRPLPAALAALRDRGVQIIPHGLRLSLGGAEKPDSRRVAHLAELAQRVNAPLVSEHVAFVRAGGGEAGHLMPVPRTREALDIVVDNVKLTQAQLPVPIALEHVASLIEWPEGEMSEASFLAEILFRTDALLLLDVANLYANSHNHAFDPLAFLDHVPLDRIAYVHVGGGVERDGVYHDTHTHPVIDGVLELLEEVCSRSLPPGVLLERDDDFPPAEELTAELKAIRTATERGTQRGDTRAAR